jgi:hypothetical protein
MKGHFNTIAQFIETILRELLVGHLGRGDSLVEKEQVRPF